MQKAYGERSVTMRHLLQGGYPMNQPLKRALKDTVQSLKHLITFWKVKLSSKDYQAELLKPPTVYKILLLGNVLTNIKLYLLLKSDHKNLQYLQKRRVYPYYS